MLKPHAKRAGITVERFHLHEPHASAATNALDQDADIAQVQPDRADVSTTCVCGHRKTRSENWPICSSAPTS